MYQGLEIKCQLLEIKFTFLIVESIIENKIHDGFKYNVNY